MHFTCKCRRVCDNAVVVVVCVVVVVFVFVFIVVVIHCVLNSVVPDWAGLPFVFACYSESQGFFYAHCRLLVQNLSFDRHAQIVAISVETSTCQQSAFFLLILFCKDCRNFVVYRILSSWLSTYYIYIYISLSWILFLYLTFIFNRIQVYYFIFYCIIVCSCIRLLFLFFFVILRCNWLLF
jgi:hypothetical protein